MEDILKTAHIHLDNATFRVHVKDSAAFDIGIMNHSNDKPEGILWVGRSNDPEQTKQSILVCVCDGYNLEEIAEWISKYNKV